MAAAEKLIGAVIVGRGRFGGDAAYEAGEAAPTARKILPRLVRSGYLTRRKVFGEFYYEPTRFVTN